MVVVSMVQCCCCEASVASRFVGHNDEVPGLLLLWAQTKCDGCDRSVVSQGRRCDLSCVVDALGLSLLVADVNNDNGAATAVCIALMKR